MSEVLFVGTSDAFGAGGRRQSAIVFRAATGSVLIDCGSTTGGGLNEMGIARDEIDSILVSHFHADHFGGIPLLLLAALYEDERRHPIRIAGPPGIEARVHALADAMGHGFRDRSWTFPILFEELPAGREVELGPVVVRSFETRHQPDANPHGLVLQAGPQRIAYSGDTGWFEDLPRQVGEADLFICECTYHSFEFDFHLNHAQLVEHRRRFDCGRMVITHLGSEMTDRRKEADFEAADDGLVIKL